MRGTRFWILALVTALCGTTVLATAVVGVRPAVARQQQCRDVTELPAPVPWPQRMLGAERVWPMTTGAGQVVAVIGTGVADTPFLAERQAGSTDLAPATGFGAESGRPDCLGVGTGVAGIIAGRQRAGIGFHGLAPGARILSVKVVGDSYPADRQPRGSVDPATLASGIEWATGNGATVIVVAEVAYQDSPALRAAVRRALDSGILLVAAVGETQRDEPSGTTPYPAAIDGVLGVGAIDAEGMAARGSRPAHVDLVAPGDDVLTTLPGGGLGTVAGTAYAAGHVAATAALVRAHRPDASREEVTQRLLATAAPAPEGEGSARYGYGVVNPYPAVLERAVAGEPASLPAMTRSRISAEEAARARETDRANTLAYQLVAAGAGLTVLVAAAVAFGPKGHRRRWRSGLAAVPEDRPEDEHPQPPVELLADRGKPAGS
ncbi:S8 family serine peptidase [Qaidamihabitans albus]|uniref:S8 family serine peptidase n=1 Tax=Qaidamihabitans albus TaxID=2795733 RepID=UPI001F22DD32|nr:S8 family serine peptidase [Qaidamihabitans albus]